MLSSIVKLVSKPNGKTSAGGVTGKRIRFRYDEHFALPQQEIGGEFEPLSALALLATLKDDDVACTESQQHMLLPYRAFIESGLPIRKEIEEGLYVMSTLLDTGARLSESTLGLVEKIAAKLTVEEINALAGNDRWLRNFLMNLWEFGNGADVLTSYPWNISLPIADICNARCIFCTSWFEGKALVKLSQVENFADVIANSIYIGLVGHGEPMAHPQFDKICEIIERHMDPRATAYTITNGMFLKKWGPLLDRINLRSVSVSLNAATAATHEEMMGLGADAFFEIVEGIRNLTSKGLTSKDRMVSITMVVTQQNIHEIPAFIALGEALNVNQVWLRSLLPQARLTPGLNYHLLPPSLHPDYADLRRKAVNAIALSKVPVQADPSLWDAEVFAPSLKDEIRRNPPRLVTRADTLRDKALRRQSNDHYQIDRAQLRGSPLKDADFTRVSFLDGRAQVETRTIPWSYAVRFAIALPAEKQAKGRVLLRAENVRGQVGYGLLDRREPAERQRTPPKNADLTKVAFGDGRARLETRTIPWSYALRFAIVSPSGRSGKGRVFLRAEDVRGYMGFGLLDVKADVWIARVLADKPGDYDIELAFEAPHGPMDLVVHNGQTDNTSSSCTITEPRIVLETESGEWSQKLSITQATVDGSADPAADMWISRVLVDKPGDHDIELAFDAPHGPMDLVIQNGQTDNTSSSCTIGEPCVVLETEDGEWSQKIAITQAVVDASPDPLEDGLNPFNRLPRFACKAPYYNLYVNEMYYRVVPCCFMQATPGFEEIRFDGSQPFMDVWNAPSMVELRKRLRDGPLFGACKKCPEKW